MRKHLYTMSVFVLSMLVCAMPTEAEESKAEAIDKEKMQKMMELSSPGEKHKVLDGMVGSWTYTMSYRMAPDAPEQFTEGTAENNWILDGRQLKQIFTGVVDMGEHAHQFEGIGFIGHDNLTGEYTSIWMDNMGTGTMVAKGVYDAATKTITETGTHTCAMRGEEVKFRNELTFIDADNYSFTMYDLSVEKPYKSLEIKYTRSK